MLRVIAVREVLQDGAALKDADGLAIGESVCEGRNATIGVDLEEPRLLLGVLADLNVCRLWRSSRFVSVASVLWSRIITMSRTHLVLEPELLEQDGDLDAVGRLGRVEVDVGLVGGHGSGYLVCDLCNAVGHW